MFNDIIEIYYFPRMENIILINPATLFMFATVEGSSGRKLCVNKESYIKENDLIYVGDF